MSTRNQATTSLPSEPDAANQLMQAIVRAVAEYSRIEHRRATLAGQAKRRARLQQAAGGAHDDH